MDEVPTTKIWIVRRGNGKAEVHPSPAVLRYNETFAIRNLTGETAEVVFPPDTIVPEPSKGRTARSTAGIPPGGDAPYRVVVRGPQFLEYKVTLPGVGQYAEGGSKPGVIIEP